MELPPNAALSDLTISRSSTETRASGSRRSFDQQPWEISGQDGSLDGAHLASRIRHPIDHPAFPFLGQRPPAGAAQGEGPPRPARPHARQDEANRRGPEIPRTGAKQLVGRRAEVPDRGIVAEPQPAIRSDSQVQAVGSEVDASLLDSLT